MMRQETSRRTLSGQKSNRCSLKPISKAAVTAMPEEGTVQNLDNPQCQTEEVKCLSAFVARVRAIREEWGIDKHKELWFRGEGEKHEQSILRSALYRTQKVTTTMKKPSELLEIECELYEEFQRCGAQLLSEKLEEK